MDKPMTPLQAIKAKCLECCGGDRSMVKTCNSKICPLVPFRFGHNPYSKRTMSDEQKAQAVERLAKARERKNNNED